MVVSASTPEQKQLAALILQKELGVCPSDELRAIFWVNDESGVIEWVTGYTGFIGKTCQMHVWSNGNKRAPRKMLFASFDYPFNQLKIETVFGVCNSNNESAMRFDHHIGWVEFSRFEKMHENDGDIVLFKMAKDECRWIKEKHQ